MDKYLQDTFIYLGLAIATASFISQIPLSFPWGVYILGFVSALCLVMSSWSYLEGLLKK